MLPVRTQWSASPGQTHLWALKLDKPTEWKRISSGPRLQGLAMVAYRGQLYRVGGFTAMNAEGDDQDLQSQTTAAKYDCSNGEWADLPPLLEPRSSHDAAIFGNTLYVVGGEYARQGRQECLA